jgi:hypothetical protein
LNLQYPSSIGGGLVAPSSPKGRLGVLSRLYGQNCLELAARDTVRITRNFRDEGHQFRNNELSTITAIDGTEPHILER